MESIAAPSYLTPAEYLVLERKATTKSEYLNGRVYAMVGASRAHNLIAVNMASELHGQLRERPCETYINDMRVKVDPAGLYTYPDVVVVCEEPRFEDDDLDTLLNPTVLIEILSPSTEAYDRGEKFAYYRQLESLREYLLIAQNRVCVERYFRQEAQWLLTEFSALDDEFDLVSIGCQLSLRTIYAKIEFPAGEGPRSQKTS